jgi:DNA-binding NtrC family response regulator
MDQTPIDILIVDDEPEFAEMLGLRLEQRGHRVRLAPDGREALAALAERAPDVVLLDLRLPGMDGLDVLQRIKAEAPLVEVILLTGYGSVDTAVAGLKGGAFDYLQKPADPDELQAMLVKASRRKAEHEARIRRAEGREPSRDGD